MTAFTKLKEASRAVTSAGAEYNYIDSYNKYNEAYDIYEAAYDAYNEAYDDKIQEKENIDIEK